MRPFITGTIGTLLLLLSCQQKQSDNKEPDRNELKKRFTMVLEDYYNGSMALDPVRATSNGYEKFNDSFPNYLTDAYKDSSVAFYKRFKDRAEGFQNQYLSENDQISKEMLLWDCMIHLEELEFRKELIPLDQKWSINHVIEQYASGTSAQPFKTVKDYDNWLTRLDDYVLWVRTAEQRMREGVDIRHVLPSTLILKLVPQLKAMADEDVEEHLFYSPVRIMPEAFPEADKQRLKLAFHALLSEKLIPAYKSLYDYVSGDYLEQGRTSSGIDGISGGKKYYDFSIKKYTTTDMSAEEIHQLGLAEVNRISLEMIKVKEQLGFEDDLLSFFEFLRNDKNLMPYSTPDEVIHHFNEIHSIMKPQLKLLFNTFPKTKFEVKRIEEYRQASSNAHYNAGSLKDDRPGVFYVPIPDASTYNVLGDEALFLHEAIPGHHYQVALTQENDSLPEFRRSLWYSAYGEGWALYTESLGRELGLYKDPYQYFGMLSEEMHRAIRLVVDTGLHAKQWTREQAIQYSLEHESATPEVITSEIERYMANPGQALSYKIGQLKILELREKAEVELGDSFDVRAFHHEVLRHGTIPLVLLEKLIEQWISEQRLVK